MSDVNTVLFSLAVQARNDQEWLAALEFFCLLISSEYNGNGFNSSSMKKNVEDDIIAVLNHIGEDEKFSQLPEWKQETKLQQIQNVYYDNTEVLIAISCAYFGLDLHEKALETAQKALTLEFSATTLETFENICCHVVDRWHFIMLNDSARNGAYKDALQEVLNRSQRDVSVLDIGCGTGVLSFLAAKWSSKVKVYAVERSSLMCKIAQNTLGTCCDLDKNIVERISIINKMSTEINVGTDVPSGVDVLVTEIFDAGLFGERILSTLSHAWKELLKSDTNERSVVIPRRATLYVEAIESEDHHLESVCHEWKYGVKTGSLQISTNVGLLESDPYTSIHLNNLPGGFKSLTGSEQFLSVDFNDPQRIFEMNEGVSGGLTLNVVEEGMVDALVVWFKLHLTDSVEVSTHMESGGCWEQAVFPVSGVRLREIPTSDEKSQRIKLCSGDRISAVYSIEDDRLSMSVSSITRLTTQCVVIDTRPDFPSPSQLLSHPLAWCPYNVYCLSDWEIKMLNSKMYQETLLAALEQYCAIDNTLDTQFLHINDGFSPLCLHALFHGFSQVQVLASQDSHKALLWKLVQINNLDIGKIKTIEDVSELEVPEFMEHSGCQESSSSFPTSKEDKDKVVVVFDVVDHVGRLVENWTDKLESIKEYLCSFTSKHILPGRIDIWGEFIESDCLLKRNRVVSNENVLGYPVKDHVNKYSTMNHPDLSLSKLQHTKLTSPFKIFSLNFMDEVNNIHPKQETSVLEQSNSCVEDRNQNVMKEEENTWERISCTNQVVSLTIPTIADGRLDAMVYWFELHLSPSHCISTLDPAHHWHQAAVILDHGVVVQRQELNVKFSLQNSTMFVHFSQ